MEYVLITGGTSGIGYELARRFAGDGYGIIIVSSNMERLEKARQKLVKEYGVTVLTYLQDLGKLGAALQLYNRIKEDKIDISILINNAGIGLVGPTEKIDFHHDESMMILNVINLVELCKLYIPDMYKQGDGKILNVASTGAFEPGPYTSTYFASKAFVLSYSRAIRYETREKGIQICTLCPGATKTNFFAQEGTKTPDNAMSVEKVAGYAYKRFLKNRDITVPGLINKIMIKFPMWLKIRFIAKMKK